MIMKHIATLTLNSAATWTLRKGMTALLLAGVCGSALTTARAASYTFDANTSSAGVQDGAGTWNTTLSNFWNGTSDVKWPNQDTDVAVFGAGGGAGTMTITTGTVTTNGITFGPVAANSPYVISGGTITLAGANPTITVNTTNGGTINSTLVGTQGFIKAGTGGLTIGATADLSSLSGTIRVDAGSIFLAANGAAAAWQLNSSSATLGLSSYSTVSIGELSGVANSSLRTSGGAPVGSYTPTASIGALNTNSTFAGKIYGTIAITKVGTGTLTLSGSGNTYTGATIVSQGTLLLSGAGVISSSSPSVDVQSGATLDVSGVTGGVYTFAAAQLLKGAGTIKGNSIVSGSLQPGSSPGILSFTNNLTLANTTQTTIDLASGTRGTNFDGINVGGALVYDGTLTFSIGAALLNGTYNIFDFASKSGAFDLLAFSGGVYAGTFVYDGTALWTATDTNGSGQSFTFDQASGDLTVVPEPNTWTLALFGAIAGLILIRRRRDAAKD
ncbi:autotransporter-associated beta strand repeat-containing protein [Terrimicrobium sacchariphilum]|uniref:Autotransporter-associated beta strand repeat-containing protein n=2 Tax=Terrimicrobium sacchariphilum TaxID=690879 RepID=A0A146G583_TERSA|nr:autotransporter-associated beta strand repeat-containing protein [Terrimicrobium sacchariphilum]